LLSAIRGGAKLRSAKSAPPVKQKSPPPEKKAAGGAGGGMPNIAMLAMAARGNLKKTGRR